LYEISYEVGDGDADIQFKITEDIVIELVLHDVTVANVVVAIDMASI
jgi:hypothetical protein